MRHDTSATLAGTSPASTGAGQPPEDFKMIKLGLSVFSLVVGLTVGTLVLGSTPRGVHAQTVTAVVGARIIDGSGGPVIPDGTILVRADRIEAVGENSAISVPSGARVIDARGMTAMPGLADMHVHLVGGWDGESTDLLGYQRYLNALLYSGVTTAQDVGGVLLFMQQLRQAVDAGRIAGPRLRFVGPLLDGAVPVWPPISARVTSADQVELLVSQQAAGGVDALKVYGTLTGDLVGKIVETAATHELPVIADLGPRNGSLEVAQTGIDAFAHAGFAPIADQTISHMAEHGMATITTLAVIESFARHRFDDLGFLDDELLSRTMPPWFRDELVAHATEELSDEQTARAAQAAAGLANGMANVRRLHQAGVLLVAGTDSPYPGVFFGEGLHRELELLVEAGLTPLEAISAATRNAAVLSREEGEWGSIVPGLVADLILVRGQPDVDISDSRNIELVMQAGRLVDREALEFDEAVDRGFRASRPMRDPF